MGEWESFSVFCGKRRNTMDKNNVAGRNMDKGILWNGLGL
jgi:hypothetical protein